LAFSYTKAFGTLRHQGIIYVSWVVTLGLALYETPQLQKYKSWKTPVLALLSAGTCAGLIAHCLHTAAPFSAALEASRWMKANHLEESFIVGDFDYKVSTLTGYLNRPIYYLSTQEQQRFVRYKVNKEFTEETALLKKIYDLHQRKTPTESTGMPGWIVVLSYPLKAEFAVSQNAELKELARFERSLLADEKFYIYQLAIRKNEKKNEYL
jgi:hypothetical protein